MPRVRLFDVLMVGLAAQRAAMTACQPPFVVGNSDEKAAADNSAVLSEQGKTSTRTAARKSKLFSAPTQAPETVAACCRPPTDGRLFHFLAAFSAWLFRKAWFL